jgi:hypothetical protein
MEGEMVTNHILAAITGILALSGCSQVRVVNSDNTNCEFRLDSDRQRCLQATQSNERIMGEQFKAKRDAKKSREASTASAPTEERYSTPIRNANQTTGNATQ